MININFDNPYYLFIAIPLLALVLVSFFIAFRKENLDKHVFSSLAIHLIMVVFMACAVAGMNTTATLTETHVYVVADVSYSANRNLDVIDTHIRSVEKNLPGNSKLGVVCFGRDYTLLSGLGEKTKSVKTAEVDDSATDIYSALDYTSMLFENDVIKRIVLITDGRQTGGLEETALYNTIETFKQQGIYVDAIFLDSTLPETAKEVQIKGVDYIQSTYVGRGDEAYVFLQSSFETPALVNLYCNEQFVTRQSVNLIDGENDVIFQLDTSTAGQFEYKVTVSGVDTDELSLNNEYYFSQSVTESKKVLLITSTKDDVTSAKQTYGVDVELTSYVAVADDSRTLTVPTSLEELCAYDEIVLSNIDIRILNDYTQFVDNLNVAVSTYGKSLLTFGDLQLQNKTDDAETLEKLENMLPIKFGASEQDPTLYGIVIDASHSMNQAGRWEWTIEAAKYLINQIRETDGFAITYFASTGETLSIAKKATVINKNEAINALGELQTGQGTYIGSGLNRMLLEMRSSPVAYTKKQVILISDGKDYTGSTAEFSATGIAAQMRAEGMRVSALNIGASTNDSAYLQSIVSAGGGRYYEAFSESQLKNVLENSITDNLMGMVVQESTRVNIQNPLDEVLGDITSFSNIQGYICGKALPGAIVVLNVEYKREEGLPTEIPLYAYKDCGNGRVSTFTSSLSGRWVQDFLDESGKKFFENIISTNTPDMRTDYPYTVNITTGDNTELEVVPGTLSRETSVTIKLTDPSGVPTEKTLVFDGKRHSTVLDTFALGEYSVEITYTNNGVAYTTTKQFYIAYKEEYDAFAGYDAGLLYQLVDDRGTVSLDGDLKIENDPDEIATYTMNLTFPFMILCVVLYVVDIMIRKLKWEDIKGLFVKINKPNKGGKA